MGQPNPCTTLSRSSITQPTRIISWHVPWREERSESVQKVVFVGMLERGEQQSNVRWQGGRQPGQAVCPMSRTKLVETVQ